jgi:hypothetical protein
MFDMPLFDEEYLEAFLCLLDQIDRVRYFVPTEEEKAKIQWFIENFGGEEDDPWVKDLVELAKAVLEEVQQKDNKFDYNR